MTGQAVPQRSRHGQCHCSWSAGCQLRRHSVPQRGFCPDGWLRRPAEHRLRAPWGCSATGLCFPEDAGQDVHGCKSKAGPPALLSEEAQNRWGSGCVFLGCDRFAQYYKLAVLVCFPSIKRKMLQNCLEYEWIHTPYVAIYIYIHLGHPAGLVMEQVLVVSSYSSAHKHLSANNWMFALKLLIVISHQLLFHINFLCSIL